MFECFKFTISLAFFKNGLNRENFSGRFYIFIGFSLITINRISQQNEFVTKMKVGTLFTLNASFLSIFKNLPY